jgi:serine/threonine protein kinase/Tfp pilus assembly protein PilF
MDDLIGKTLSGYQIIEQIGKGGMATVYRAYQPSLDRDVAVKVLPPYYADQDETFIARFRREARAIAKLRHQNILMVMDFGQEDNLSYIVMEYVDAGTMKERMRSSMTLQEVYTLVGQIASALDYAHEQGVVHRDVKPSNILLPKPDWVLLTDFGLARMVGGSFMTQSGLTVGTPAYMSPEQGSGNKIDHRTDVYSLGVMLYELVVGEVPYTAETPMAVVVKHIVDPLPLPRDKNPNVPERLQQVILKALAKNPEDRFNSAGEIVAAMEPVVSEIPDWSAASIKVVDATREPVVDIPDTKVMEEEELTAESVGAAEAQTVQDQAPLKEAPSTPSSPISPDTIKKPKRKVWAFALGALAVLAVCVAGGFFTFKALQPQFDEWFGGQPAAEVADLNDGSDNDLGEADFPDEPPPPVEDGFEDPFAAAINYLRNGNLIRAAETLQEALREDPRLWNQFFILVTDKFEQGDFRAALHLFRAGVEAHPNPPLEDLNKFGWMLLDTGHDQDAYDIFIEIIERNPAFGAAYDGLSSAALYLQKEQETLDFLIGYSEAHPEEPMILAGIADLYYWIGEYQNAIDYYERTFEMHPNDPWVYMISVEVYIVVEDYDRAIEMIDTAVEMAPDNSVIADMAGTHYHEMGMDEAAIEAFLRAVSLDPQNGWAQVGLAEILIYLQRDLDSVPGYLENAERVGRETIDYWLLESVAWGWADFGDCFRAIPLFQMIAEEAGDMIDVQEGLAFCRDN